MRKGGKHYPSLKGRKDMQHLTAILQFIFLIIGSVLFGYEFGARVGYAVLCIGYALLPHSGYRRG